MCDEVVPQVRICAENGGCRETGIPTATENPFLKPEIKELVEHMESIPLLYHEILSHFQRFKIDNRSLVESVA